MGRRRPFVGDRGQPFKVFRHYEGNFYTAIVYSLQKLSRGENQRSTRDVYQSREPVRSLMDVPSRAAAPESGRAGAR